MLTETPVITTRIQALDELDDVRYGLEGLSRIVSALGCEDAADEYSLSLVARLLGYLGSTMEAACGVLYP